MQNSGHCDKAGAGGYNETTFVQTMDVLVSTGLDKLGYVYLNAGLPPTSVFSRGGILLPSIYADARYILMPAVCEENVRGH